MGLPTKEEQLDINDWYEKQRGGVTTSVKKAMGELIRDYALIEKFEALAKDKDKFREDAAKAWKTVERLEKRLQRAYSAANSAYQMDVKE